MNICMFAFAIAALMGLALAGAPQEPPDEAPAGIVNYSRVDATVACGGATPAGAMADLKQMGFAAVINLRTDGEPGADIPASRHAAASAGLKYIHIPFSASEPDPAAVARFLEAVAEPAHQPVYIHCGTANRVGAVWLIKRVLQDGWPVEKATAEAEAIGLRAPALRQFALDYLAARH